MSSGRVHALVYRLDTSRVFENPEPIAGTREFGSFELRDETLTIRLAGEIASVSEARETVAPFLKSWTVQADIVRDGPLRFAFVSAVTDGHVADASDFGPEGLRYKTDDEGPVVFVNGRYPQAPEIELSAEIEAAWARYFRAYVAYPESLLSASYYVLTVAETRAGGSRRRAARQLHMDFQILSKVGELSSTRGDASTARKALAVGGARLTSSERAWLDSAIRYLVLALGRHEAGVEPIKVEMADLLPLPGNK